MGSFSIGNFQRVKAAAGALAIILSLGVLGGCQTARDPDLVDDPNYARGYADGCQTGHSRIAGFDDTITKDRGLSEREPAYEIGWRDGYNSCGGQPADGDREIFVHDSEHWDSVPR